MHVTIDLNEQEQQLLLETLVAAEKELLSEISHTDTRDYRIGLRTRLALIEKLRKKMEPLVTPTTVA